MCWGGGAWYPSRTVGDWRDVSLPDVPSGVGAAGSKLGNEGWEAGKAPVGSVDPQSSLLAGAGEQTRFYRGDEMQICASASPPFLQFP